MSDTPNQRDILRLTPESISALKLSNSSKNDQRVLAELSGRCKICLKPGGEICIIDINPDLEYYFILANLMKLLLQMDMKKLQIDFDSLQKFLGSQEMIRKKESQSISLPANFKRQKEVFELIGTISGNFSNTSLANLALTLLMQATELGWFKTLEVDMFVNGLVKMKQNPPTDNPKMVGLVNTALQQLMMANLSKKDTLLRELPDESEPCDLLATTPRSAFKISQPSLIGKSLGFIKVKPLLPSASPKVDSSKSLKKITTQKVSASFIQNTLSESKILNEEILNHSTLSQEVESPLLDESSISPLVHDPTPSQPNSIVSMSSLCSDDSLSKHLQHLENNLKNFGNSDPDRNHSTPPCFYSDLMKVLLSFSESLKDIAGSDAFLYFIVLYWKADYQLFDIALLGNPPTYCKRECHHTDHSESCPDSHLTRSQDFLFDGLVSIVATSEQFWSWFALAELYKFMPTKAIKALSDRIWRLKSHFKFLNADHELTYQFMQLSTIASDANPMNLTFVHDLLLDLPMALKVLSKYQLQHPNGYDLCKYLSNFYSEMKKVYCRPEEWNPICEQMIKTADFATKNIDSFFDKDKYLIILEKFIDDSKTPQDEQQITLTNQYVNDANSSSEPDPKITQEVLNHLNNIASEFQNEILRRSQLNTLDKITFILKHLSQNPTPAVKKCFYSLYSAFKVFCESIFEETISYVTFKQIEEQNLKNTLWDFIESTFKELSETTAGRDGTVKMPEEWRQGKYEQAFSRMYQNCQEAKCTKNLIDDIMHEEKQFFNMIDSHALELDREILINEASLTLKQITAINCKFDNIDYLKRALRLNRMPLYSEALERHLSEVYKNKKLSLDQFNEACHKAEDTIDHVFKSWCNVISYDIVKGVERNIEWIRGEHKTILADFGLIDEAKASLMLMALYLVKVIESLQIVSGSLNRLNKFLVEETKLQGDNQDIESLIHKLKKANMALDNGSLVIGKILFTSKELKIVQAIGSNVKQLECLADVTDAIKYFSTKSSRHFQDMYTDMHPDMKILPTDIQAMQNLTEEFNEDKFESFLSYVELFMSSKFANLERLVNMKQKLIDASTEIIKGSSDKVIDLVEKVLAGSTIVFYGCKEEYSTYCRLDPDPNPDLKKALKWFKESTIDNKEQQVSKDDRLIEKEDLVDSKMKLSILSHSKDRADYGTIVRILKTFPVLVETVEEISDSLNEISKSGVITNVEKAIQKYISSSATAHGISDGQVNKLWMNEDRMIAITVLSVKFDKNSQHSASSKYDDSLAHFIVLKNALKAMLNDIEENLLNFNPKNHILLLFDTSQKMKLCKYISEVAKGSKLVDKDSDDLKGLLYYMNRKKISDIDLKQRVNKKEQLTKYTMEEELSDVLNPLSKNSTIRVVSKKESKSTRVRVYGAVFANDKFRSLLKLFNMLKVKDLQPWQIFLASPSTSTEGLRLFVMRAFFDPQKRYYFALDLHLLSEKCQEELITIVKKYIDFYVDKHSSLNMNLVLMVNTAGSGNYLYTNLLSKGDLFEKVKESDINNSNLREQDFYSLTKNLSAIMVNSELSGMGKSHYIERHASSNNSKLQTILFAGDNSKLALERRFDIIASKLNEPDTTFSLHIKLDMMDNMQSSTELIDQILFNITFLKCLPFRGGYIFFHNVVQFYVEIQNSYRDLLLNHVSILSLFEQKLVCSNSSVESIADQLQLPELRTFRFADDKPRTTVEVICIFLLSRQYKLEGRLSLLKAYGELLKNNKFSIQPTQLIELLEQATKKKIPLQYTYAQLITFLKIVSSQASLMDSIPALDPEIYRNETDAQNLLKNLAAVRETASTMIIDLANQLIWGSSKEIREETQETMKVVNFQGDHKTLAPKDLQRFRSRIDGLKKWEYSSTLNIFFYGGAMKVLYRNKSDLPKEVSDLIIRVTPEKQVVDFTTLNQEGIVKELTEALSLTTTLKPEADYCPDIKDSGARLQDYIRMRVGTFRGKGYVITLDNYLKILLIVQRADLQIPIVIMGATGCGKTYMMEFICKCLLQEEFECITLHPGVQEVDLLKRLSAIAVKAATQPQRRHWVLFDEFNTSPLQCLIAEIMTDRRSSSSKDISSERFPDNLVFVAACNPFRINAATTTVGLVHESSASILSHRVYPIPDTLINSIWDFGQLSSKSECEYIECMLISDKSFSDAGYRSKLAKTITSCQTYLRETGSDNSVSLRDVSRFIILHSYFDKLLRPQSSQDSQVIETHKDILVIVTHICYFFRLDSDVAKNGLYDKLGPLFKDEIKLSTTFERILSDFAKDIASTKRLPRNITLNRPLLENLLATVTCVANKIPIIICGKPGTSKTLSASICNMLFDMPAELKSSTKFFKHLPQIVYVNFWGSLTTTSEAVDKAFSDANKKAESLKNKLVCLLFDEIGLAEVSPHNPLKILHPLLEPNQPNIAFLGLSNWRLDQSKMNRVIFVARPDINTEELFATCKFQDVADSDLRKTAEVSAKALATAFYNMRKKQHSEKGSEHPDFHGSRDFYEAINIFKRSLALFEKDQLGVSKEPKLTSEQIVEAFMINAIQRCFGGKLIQGTRSEVVMIRDYVEIRGINIFNRNIQDVTDRLSSATELIYQNLVDPACRHLMILTESNIIEELFVKVIKEFETTVRRKSPRQIEYISYTEGREDLSSMFLSRLPIFASQGHTIILKDLDQVYGSMYDLLNLNYFEQENTKTCHLFYNNRKENTIVHEDFKCIIFMRREDTANRLWEIEKKQPPPFLNRFEKYLIQETDIIPLDQQQRFNQLTTTYLKAPEHSNSDMSYFYYVHNLSKEMLMSAAIQDCKEITSQLSFIHRFDQYETRHRDLLKASIKKMLTPESKVDMVVDPFCITSDNTQTFQNTDDSLTQMYSQNMVILESIRAKHEDCEHSFRALKKKFIETHPFNSLIDLVNSLRNQYIEHRRAIVFTWTAAWELRDLAQGYKDDIILIDCSAEFIQSRLSRETVLKDLLADPNKAVVFQFCTKQSWKLIRQVRFHIEALSEAHKSPVIFVAQVQREDLAAKLEEDSSIGFFNKNWQIWVIDNLAGCNYKEFFDLLEEPCVKILKLIYQQGGQGDLIDEVIREGLRNALACMLESGNTRKMVRGINCIRAIQGNSEVLGKLKRNLESKYITRTILSKLFDEQTFDKYLKQSLDAKNIFLMAIKTDLEAKSVKSFKDIDEKIPLEMFYLCSLFDPAIRSTLIQSIQDELGMEDTSQLNTIRPDISDRFSMIVKIEFRAKDYKCWYKRDISTIYELKVQGSSEYIDRLKQLYQKEPPASIFRGSVLFNSMDEERLAAAYIFDKYMQSNYASMWSDTVISFVTKMVGKLMQLFKEDCINLKMPNFVALMIALLELFESEFKLLLSQEEILSEDDFLALSEAMLESFAIKGLFDCSVLAQTLDKEIKILNRGQLAKMIQNFKLIESLKCETDQVDQITPGDKLVVRILEFISGLNDVEFENARRVYNIHSDKALLNRYEYFSVHVLHYLISSNEIKTSLTRDLVVSLSGQLFEVCLKKKQTQAIIVGIIEVLVLLIDGNRIDVLKWSLSIMIKIVCSLSLRFQKDQYYEVLRKRLSTLIADRPSKKNIDEETRKLIVKHFNDTVLTEFDSIIETEDIVAKKNRNVKLKAYIQSFSVTVKPVINGTSNSSLFELEFVRSIALLTFDLNQIKKNPSLLKQFQAKETNNYLEKLYNEKSAEGSKVDVPLCLILSTQFFAAFNTPSKLEQAGLPWLAQLVDSLSATSKNDMIPPSSSMFKNIQAIKVKRGETGSQAERAIVEQAWNDPAYRFDSLNMIFKAKALDAETNLARTSCFNKIPSFREFMRIALKDFQNQGTTARLQNNSKVQPSPAAMKESTHNYDSKKNCQQRTFIIGAVLNWLLTLPEQNPLSWSSLISKKPRPVLINYPSAALQKWMPLVAYYNLTRQKSGEFGKLYECKTQECGAYVVVGDCGVLMCGREDRHGICIGCETPITGGSDTSNLLEVDIKLILQKTEAMKVDLSTKYYPIPQENRDNSWIIDLYVTEINSPVAAMIARLLQSVLNFLIDSKEPGFAQKATNTLLHIIDKDFASLRALIEKDDDTTFMYLALVVWNLTYSTMKQPMRTIEEVRAYVGSKYNSTGAVINALITNYQSKRAELLQADASMQDKHLALIKGNLNHTEVSNLFKNEKLVDLWKVMQKKEVSTFDKVLRHLEKMLPEPKSEKVATQHQKKARFILEIIEIDDLLLHLFTSIQAIRRFLQFLANKFDTRFSTEEAMKITIGDMIKKEMKDTEQSAEGTLNYKSSREETELAEEYKRFSKTWNELVVPMLLRYESKIKLKFECELVGPAIEILRHLCSDDTPLISFLCVQTRFKEPKAVVMRALLEGLATLQNELIDKFSVFADIGESAVSKLQINVFKAPKNAFVRLSSNVRQDIQTHSTSVHLPAQDIPDVATDIDYLTTKYAQEVFRGAMILRVDTMFHFSDDDNRSLDRLVANLQFKVSQASPSKVSHTVLKDLEWLELQQDLGKFTDWKCNLQLIIVQLLRANSLKEADTIEEVRSRYKQPRISSFWPKELPVGHLRLVVWKLYEQAYSEALKKAKTLQKPESDKNEKSKIPPQRGLQGLKLEQDDREKWVWLLKSAYSKAVLDATEGSSPLEEPLRDAVDEEWEKQIDQFKTAAGLAPEQSLTFGDVPQLISLLSSSKN